MATTTNKKSLVKLEHYVFSHITKIPGVCGGKATIDGRRVLRKDNEIRIRVPFGFFDDVPNFIYDADSKGRWTVLLKPGVGVVRATAGSSADSQVFEFNKGRVGGELIR